MLRYSVGYAVFAVSSKKMQLPSQSLGLLDRMAPKIVHNVKKFILFNIFKSKLRIAIHFKMAA